MHLCSGLFDLFKADGTTWIRCEQVFLAKEVLWAGGCSQKWVETTDFYIEPTSKTSWRVTLAIQFAGTYHSISLYFLFPCIIYLLHASANLLSIPPHVSSTPDSLPKDDYYAGRAHPSLPQPLHLRVTIVDHDNMTTSLRLEQVCVYMCVCACDDRFLIITQYKIVGCCNICSQPFPFTLTPP